MNFANALLVALVVAATKPAPTRVLEPSGEIGNWSAADRREFLDACRKLKGTDEACTCLLAVFERHVVSLEDYRENFEQTKEDVMKREGQSCEQLSTLP